MKISEILQPKQPSAINDTKTLDVVAQDTAPSNRSAIMAKTMRSGGASQRLKGIQIRTGKGTSPMARSGKLLKSKFVKPAKSKK